MNRRNQRQTNNIYIGDASGYAFKTAAMVLDFFLFILSIGIFGFGIWLAVWTNNFSTISIILNNDSYRAAYILLIIAGSVLCIVSFIGFCGSQNESTIQILVFTCAVAISFVMLIASAACAMAFNAMANRDVAANLTVAIGRYYGVNLNVARTQSVTNAIDEMQKQFKCCGVIGTGNSTTSWFSYRSSAWLLQQNGGPPFIPLSCCTLDAAGNPENANMCQGKTPFKVGQTAAPRNRSDTVQNDFLYEQGCVSRFSQTVNYFSLAIFGLALGSALYLIIILVLTCGVLRKIEVGKKSQSGTTITPSVTPIPVHRTQQQPPPVAPRGRINTAYSPSMTSAPSSHNAGNTPTGSETSLPHSESRMIVQ